MSVGIGVGVCGGITMSTAPNRSSPAVLLVAHTGILAESDNHCSAMVPPLPIMGSACTVSVGRGMTSVISGVVSSICLYPAACSNFCIGVDMDLVP